jgi:hypothetical protein
VLFKNLLVR